MQFSDLYGTQLDLELASSDRTQLFTTARRKKAVNDAMHNFERITGATVIYGTITLVSGVGEYDLLATFSDYISLARNAEPAVSKTDPTGAVTWIQGDDLPRRDPVWLDRQAPGWRADPASTPAAWYLRDDSGSTFVGLDPPPSIPSGWTYGLLVPYLAQSVDLSADADQPFSVGGTFFSRLAPYHQALVHYAAGLLEAARKNYPGADRQMKLYAGYIAQYETKATKDAPTQVTYVRNYLRDARRTPARPVDPHRF